MRLTLKKQSEYGMFCPGWQNGMGCYVRGDKNDMGCYVRGDKNSVGFLSGVANLCGMFCPGCKKMAWDVLSRDVLSGSHRMALKFQLYLVTVILPFEVI